MCCSWRTGGLLRWEDSELNDVLSLKGRTSLSGMATKNTERQDIRRGRDGHMESSGQEEADDIFETEFTMLQDLWQFDSVPFPVTKQVRLRYDCERQFMVSLTCASRQRV